jgi:UDP-glucose 4-epimerase
VFLQWKVEVKNTILILGGAGYIGSHTACLMANLGYEIVIIDKFIHAQCFSPRWATIIKDDFANKDVLRRIFSSYKIMAVFHFAAFIEVGESVKNPSGFYQNNVGKTLQLLETLLEFKVKYFIFSSSCAVYGEPIKIPMSEDHPKNPVSPYGRGKLAVEFILQDYANAYDFKFVSLRYFNAAGSAYESGLGEQHKPETHLIPLLLRSILNKKIIQIFGSDYNTPDGTCIRDYIHVLDIAKAHILALEYLKFGGKSDVFNLGTGRGYTVKQVIQTAEKTCKQSANIKLEKRRPGDSMALVADSSKVKEILGWTPRNSELSNILTSALLWENRNKIRRVEL